MAFDIDRQEKRSGQRQKAKNNRSYHQPADKNRQGIGLPPEERTVQQELYRRFHQQQIHDRMEAQENNRPAPEPQIDPRRYIAQQRSFRAQEARAQQPLQNEKPAEQHGNPRNRRSQNTRKRPA